MFKSFFPTLLGVHLLMNKDAWLHFDLYDGLWSSLFHFWAHFSYRHPTYKRPLTCSSPVSNTRTAHL